MLYDGILIVGLVLSLGTLDICGISTNDCYGYSGSVR